MCLQVKKEQMIGKGCCNAVKGRAFFSFGIAWYTCATSKVETNFDDPNKV